MHVKVDNPPPFAKMVNTDRASVLKRSCAQSVRGCLRRDSSSSSNGIACPKRSVVIDEALNTQHDCTFDLEKERCWYSSRDYKRFKSANSQLVRDMVTGRGEFRKVSLFWRQAVERAYGVLCQETLESLEADELDLEDESLLSDGEQFHLSAVYNDNNGSGECPLGLEHLLVEAIAIDRHLRRQELIDRLFCVMEASSCVALEVEEHILALSSQALSLTSRLFYRETAMALAARQLPLLADDSSVSSTSSSDASESPHRR